MRAKYYSVADDAADGVADDVYNGVADEVDADVAVDVTDDVDDGVSVGVDDDMARSRHRHVTKCYFTQAAKVDVAICVFTQ
jgi:hypothetical protein